MKSLRTGLIIIAVLLIAFFGILLTSCGKKSLEGMIIFTEVSRKSEGNNYNINDSGRYMSGSRIVALDPAHAEKSEKVLTTGFYSARSPEISSDGKNLLFTGQLKENDPWQIWEMNLTNSKINQITFSKDNCTDPAYMPLGQIVFSQLLENDSLKSEHSLFVGNLDGSDIKRITFNPHTYISSTVLKDGRILSVSRRIYPCAGNPSLMVMRPDGTKYGLFYQGNSGSAIVGRCWETMDNKILFIESDSSGSNEGNVIAVNYNSPLHSLVNITSGIQGDFKSVFPEKSGKLLVSYRPSNSARFALYELDPVTRTIGNAIYADNDFDILEAVEVSVHERARKLPSEVHMDIKTGLIVCQDVNLHDPQIQSISLSVPATAGLEIMGIDSSLGVVEPEKDGSVYLKIIADKPFKIRSLDNHGHVIQECDWLWLRPNERRGCVGCHEDHDLVPENRIPLAVRKSPVSVPIHVSKIKEKFIDTE
jgi:hypothetical protein